MGGAMISLAFLFQVFVPVITTAQGTQLPGANGTQANSKVSISNPLKVNSIQNLISEGLKFVVNLLAIAGVVYIIWTGFMFVKAQGNQGELEAAKKAFFNAIVGMAIILGAWAIAQVVANTINKITNNNNVTLKAQ